MKLTKEQHNIINAEGNLRVNAVAGSGKTTTIIEYAKSRPAESKILYLAFNKSVKMEAQRKFREAGLSNVRVETAHSLAYKHTVLNSNLKVRHQGYKTYELVELLGLQATGDKLAPYIIANHINKLMAYFCNSDKQKVQELDYRNLITDSKAQAFVNTFYSYIERQSRMLLAKMYNAEIEVTHDYYLKKFQLDEPRLNYDYILFDEGQDASPAMLDVFLKQRAVKVIVGDAHQQIYGWRHAVNSLAHVDFQTYHLSTSFRFSQAIADLAVKVLDWKTLIGPHLKQTISGKGDTKEVKLKAVLGRTNLGLLLKAIEYVTTQDADHQLYFEGNIHSYTYADDGTSLYDVLSLYNNRRAKIKDKLIRQMKDLDELEDYIEKTEDMQLGMMVEVIKQHGNEIPGLIEKIKQCHVKDEDRTQADAIFSTVHRAKGMEYDHVTLVNDFINEEKIKKLVESGDGSPAKLSEEINLLYVAVTRTKNTLEIPEPLLPLEITASDQIMVVPVEDKEEGDEDTRPSEILTAKLLPAKIGYASIREKHKEAYQRCTSDMDEQLEDFCDEGRSVADIAVYFGRTKGAIRSRIKKLEI